MITIGSKFKKDNKIYKVVEQGTWGFKLESDDKDVLIYSNTTINIAIKDKEIIQIGDEE